MTFYVFYMMLGNLIISPLTNMFDPFYLWKLLRQAYARKKLEKDILQHYTQKDLNTLYEPPEMCLYLRYCNIIRTFLVSVFFFEICPAGIIISLIYLIVQFWVDKVMVLRRYKRLPRYHPNLAHELNEIAEVSIFLLAAGSWIFKWRAGQHLHVIDICCLVVGVLFLVVPLKSISTSTANSQRVIQEYNEHNIERYESDHRQTYTQITKD